jgi:hypothetical protein
MSRTEEQLRALLAEGQEDGSISLSLDPQATARLLLSLIYGLRVLGKTGPTPAQAYSVVDGAMALLDQ